MISVEWFDNGTCNNCGQDKPHCARIEFLFEKDGTDDERLTPEFNGMLCSDCTEDLKKRLS